jgi:hypothetical protein
MSAMMEKGFLTLTSGVNVRKRFSFDSDGEAK